MADTSGARERTIATSRSSPGVVDPVVETAPLQRVVELAGPVGGEHHDRRGGGPDRAQLGDADLVRREHLQQERLELVVGPVDLIDQQHHRALLQRGEHRAGEQEPLVVQALLGLLGGQPRLGTARDGLQCPQVQDLAREVPVVERLGGVDPLVALQPDQRQPQPLGDRLGQRGLAGARLPLEQQRTLHAQRQERDRGQVVVAQVPGVAESRGDVCGGRRLHGARLRGGALAPGWSEGWSEGWSN